MGFHVHEVLFQGSSYKQFQGCVEVLQSKHEPSYWEACIHGELYTCASTIITLLVYLSLTIYVYVRTIIHAVAYIDLFLYSVITCNLVLYVRVGMGMAVFLLGYIVVS